MTPVTPRPPSSTSILALLSLVTSATTACHDSPTHDADAGVPSTSTPVSGVVIGLDGAQAVRLQLGSTEALTVTSNGAFTFATSIPWGADYDVAVGLAPIGSACTVTGGRGVSTEGVPTNVEVNCTNASDVTNAVYPTGFADPSVIRADDGTYYAFATGGPILESTDLAHWTYASNFITNSNGGYGWGSTTALGSATWAPDVVKIAGRYVLYYSRSTWGDSNPGIGVAVADHPTGPWDNHGKLFDSTEIGVNNSIDPGVFVAEDGRVFMVWGSMRGNYLVELTADGLALAHPATAGTDRVRFAGLDTATGWTVTTYEGAYVRFRDGFYYLFLSSGTCCANANSTYHVVVGRSASPTGPYVDHLGRLMTDVSRGYDVVAGTAEFKGPGHNALVDDANGDWWLVYHAYPAADPSSRLLMVDRLVWTADGWPSVPGIAPSVYPFARP